MSTELAGKTVVVLDVHGILYQVFHTMREMSGPMGQPTGAAFGLVRDVMNILAKLHPDYVFCAFDLPGKTFRHELRPDYKANRPPMPDDLRPQTVYVRRILDGLCIARLEKEGFEADDLLATVAHQAKKAGGKTILVTSDKDARQLISDQVSLYNLRKDAPYTAVELEADWGIRPDQVVDYQTLVGDSTDNIPGIPLIGPKTATALLQEFGTLENIFANTDKLKGKKRENLEKGAELAETTRKMVRLDDAVPIEIDWEKGKLRGIDTAKLGEIFRELGFRSLLPKIRDLAEKFGERKSEESEIDEALLENGSSSPKKSAIPHQKSLFDDEKDESPLPDTKAAPTSANNSTGFPYDPFVRIEEENAPITERLFAALENGVPPIVRFPRTDAFGRTAIDSDAICYHRVDTPEKFDVFLKKLQTAPVFSFDLETVDCDASTKVRPRFALIVGMAFCFDAQNAWYLPIRGPLSSDLLPEKATLDALRPIFENPAILKMGQNIKFDRIVLRNVGVEFRGVFFDTMVADYLLHSGERRHNLDELAEDYLGYQTVKISELIGTGKNQKTMNSIATETVARYAGEDALVPWFLYPLLLTELEKRPGLLRLLAELEIPLIDVLVEMESNGIAIDRGQFDRLTDIFQKKIDLIETQVRDLVREADPDLADSFNLNSPQQLQRILFDDLKLPVIKKTKTGRSTDVEVLEQLAHLHPLPAKLIEHRGATKLMGTYIEPIPDLVHPVTGRIHASFNQVVTATGRLSSSDPNLQNIPVRSEEGKMIRRGFVPDRSLGFDTLVACDYSQIELRVLTHFSKDENLTKAFDLGVDIHAHVAGELFGVEMDQVTNEMRRVAKTVNFGLVYGQSAFGLAKTLGIPQSEAAAYIRKFFATYPGIHHFLDRVLEDCRDTGQVQTLLGRRRQIDGVRGARGDQPLNMAERTAINTVIQGSAADLMKIAMINVNRRLTERSGEEISPPLAAKEPKKVDKLSQTSLFDEEASSSTRSGGGLLFDDQDEERTPTSESVPEIKPSDEFLSPIIRPGRARLLLQIHDELIFETTANFADTLAATVVREMELGQPLSVPLKIDVEKGTNWGF